MMVWMDCCAERSLAFFLRLPTVGMAISIRMAMIAITISNSIKVKPLVRLRRRPGNGRPAFRGAQQREFLVFMGLTALVGASVRTERIRQNATTDRRAWEMECSKS